MGFHSHPLNLVEVTYDHPDVDKDTVTEFELSFTVTNSGDEPAEVTGAPAEGSSVLMKPELLNVSIEPGEKQKVTAVFKSESGWALNNPSPFFMDWTSAFGEVNEKWSISIAPERKFTVPEGVPDATPGFWKERMNFEISPQVRFGLCRDDRNVVLGMYVEKDKLYVDPEKNPFEQDGVEIRFDLRDDKARFYSDGEYEFADIIPICVSPAKKGEEHGPVYRKDDLHECTQVLCIQVEGGYLTQVSVAVKTAVFRLNVCANLFDGANLTKQFWRPAWRSEESFPWSGTFYCRGQ
jgi:hypothetical protein